MDEFRVEVRLRNNRLIRMREEFGWTQSQAARKMGVTVNTLSGYETLRHTPMGAKGWKPSAIQIADFHGVSPEWLWPDDVQTVTHPVVSGEVSAPSVRALAEGGELSRKLEYVLGTLTPREQQVLTYMYGLDGGDESDLATVGKLIDPPIKSRAAVRQVEAKALMKIRHPSRSKHLKVFIENDPTAWQG